MSPTHQNLFNDTTFSQIKSRVPVPLSGSGNCTISGYCYLEVALKKYYFREYLGENENIFEIFKGVNLGSRYYGFMKKTRHQKSHATVPLMG